MTGRNRAVIVIIILMLTVGLAYAASDVIKRAYYADMTFFLNGTKVDKAPTSVFVETTSGKTLYLPLRQIAELLGVEVVYNAANKTVSLKQSGPSTDNAKTGTSVAVTSGTAALTKDENAIILSIGSKDWKERLKAIEDLASLEAKGGFAASAILDQISKETNQQVIVAMGKAMASIGEPIYKAITARILSDAPASNHIFMLYLLRGLYIEDPKYYLSVLDYYFDARLSGSKIELMRHYIATLTADFQRAVKEDISGEIAEAFGKYLDGVYYYEGMYVSNAYQSVLRAVSLLGKSATSIAEEMLFSDNKGKRKDACTLLASIAHKDIEVVNRLIGEALYDYVTRDKAKDAIVNVMGSLAEPVLPIIRNLSIDNYDKNQLIDSISKPSKDHFVRKISEEITLKIDLIRDPIMREESYERQYYVPYMGLDITIIGSDGNIIAEYSHYPERKYPKNIEYYEFSSYEASIFDWGKSVWSYQDANSEEKIEIKEMDVLILMKYPDYTDDNIPSTLFMINEKGEIEAREVYSY